MTASEYSFYFHNVKAVILNFPYRKLWQISQTLCPYFLWIFLDVFKFNINIFVKIL